ncbi:hypothetical protein RB196_19310 [Streptomyces sp. PmtA]|uniref:hypothetical protein n=1 Tax=Streptomyces sp. PmtA TaxID=3074275 RepID=UPI0030142D52
MVACDVAMFRATDTTDTTDTTEAPWTVVKSNGKRRARLEAVRHPPTCVDHAREDPAAIGTPDPLAIAAADTLLEPGEEDTTLSPTPPAQDPTGPGQHPPGKGEPPRAARSSPGTRHASPRRPVLQAGSSRPSDRAAPRPRCPLTRVETVTARAPAPLACRKRRQRQAAHRGTTGPRAAAGADSWRRGRRGEER